MKEPRVTRDQEERFHVVMDTVNGHRCPWTCCDQALDYLEDKGSLKKRCRWDARYAESPSTAHVNASKNSRTHDQVIPSASYAFNTVRTRWQGFCWLSRIGGNTLALLCLPSGLAAPPLDHSTHLESSEGESKDTTSFS